MKYSYLKKARLEAGLLKGRGYALAPFEELASNEIEFVFRIQQDQDYAFIVGFRGVGHHYRCDIIPLRNLVVLHLIKDGIPVYLQHASLHIRENFDFRLSWSPSSLRIFHGKLCMINIVGEGLDSGRWGFAINDVPLHMPEVTMKRRPRFAPGWVVLGDGYSNNRWKNRHFFSWPELAFAQRGDYLNACVAAGNTRRVLEVIEQIQPTIAGSVVILAVGADDFIEDVSADESLGRISQIIAQLKGLGARRVHLCAIPPRKYRDNEVAERNTELAALARLEADGFIDFHQLLSPAKESLLVNGDYPGSAAQLVMAKGVIAHLGLDGGPAPLQEASRHAMLRGFMARAARSLIRSLEIKLDLLPSGGIS